jgi:hypothetical protein
MTVREVIGECASGDTNDAKGSHRIRRRVATRPPDPSTYTAAGAGDEKDTTRRSGECQDRKHKHNLDADRQPTYTFIVKVS